MTKKTHEKSWRTDEDLAEPVEAEAVEVVQPTAPVVAATVAPWSGDSPAPLVCPACGAGFAHIGGGGNVPCPACGVAFYVPAA